MEKLDYVKARKIVSNYIDSMRESSIKAIQFNFECANKRFELFEYLKDCTDALVHASEDVMTMLNASDSIKEFTKIVMLNANIGRYRQVKLYGSLDDSILASELGINNHGELGDLVLSDLIGKEVPNPYLQMPIRRIVRNHVSKEIDESSLGILSNSSIMSGDISSILIGNPEQARFIDAMTLLVRDLENLEVYPRSFGDNHGRNSFKLSNSFNVKYNEALAKVKSLHL